MMPSSVPDLWSQAQPQMLELCTYQTPEAFLAFAAEYCKTANLITLLAEETHQRFRSFMASVDLEHQLSMPAFRDVSGAAMFGLDAAAADMLETIGEHGRRYAAEIRRDSAIRAECIASTAPSADELETLLHIWSPTPDGTPRFVQGLTRVVFFDVLKPKLARARANPPAVSAVVLEELARLFRRGVRLDVVRSVLVDHNGKVICRVISEAYGATDLRERDLEVLRKGVPLLGSLQAQRLVRFLVVATHQLWSENKDRHDEIRVHQGWIGLADAVGAGTSNNAADQVRRLVETLSHLRFDWPFGDDDRLLSFENTRAVGHRPSELRITVGSALQPGAVHVLNKKKLGERYARRLVPVLPPPPLRGRPADWGAQANLQLLVLCEMHAHPEELAACGGAAISPERWTELAKCAGVPLSTLNKVIETWTTGTPSAPAFLRRQAGDVITLSHEHDAAREFFVSGAKKRLHGRTAGQRSGDRHRKRNTNGEKSSSPRKPGVAPHINPG